MSAFHPIPQNRNTQLNPNTMNRKTERSIKKWYVLGAIGAVLIVLALLALSSSAPAPRPLTLEEQAVEHYERKLASQERLTEKELDHYCQMLCEARGLCGINNCQDAISIYRESALATIKHSLKGKYIIMKDGRKVKLTGKGLRHTLKGKKMNNPKEYQKNLRFIYSVLDLERILQSLTYQGAEPPKNNNCRAVHRYQGTLEDGSTAKVVIKESHSGDFTFYDYSLQKAE